MMNYKIEKLIEGENICSIIIYNILSDFDFYLDWNSLFDVHFWTKEENRLKVTNRWNFKEDTYIIIKTNDSFILKSIIYKNTIIYKFSKSEKRCHLFFDLEICEEYIQNFNIDLKSLDIQKKKEEYKKQFRETQIVKYDFLIGIHIARFLNKIDYFYLKKIDKTYYRLK